MSDTMTMALPETSEVSALNVYGGVLSVAGKAQKLGIVSISKFINAKRNLKLQTGKGGTCNMKHIKTLVKADDLKALKKEHDAGLRSARKWMAQVAREVSADPSFRKHTKVWRDSKGNWAVDIQARRSQSSIADAVEDLKAQNAELKALVEASQPKSVTGKVVAE